MAEPISTAAIFAFLNSCIKFAEYAVKLYGVETENGIFVRLIQQVQRDLEETERLLSVPAITKKVKSIPEKWRWVRESIAATKASLNEIGKCVEPVRGEQEAYGSAKFKTKVKWIFRDHDKLVTRSRHLASAHQSLSNVLNFLSPFEDCDIEAPAPDELPTYDEATYLNPRQRLMREQNLEKSQERDKGNGEGPSNEQTTTQHNLHHSSSVNDLARSNTGFINLPPSTAAYTSSTRPAFDRDEANSNGTNPFDSMRSGRPTSARHRNAHGHLAEPPFSSSSLELPRPQPSYLTPRRSTESFAQNQRPSLWTADRNTPGAPSPNRHSTYHSAGPVNQFESWVNSATSHTTASPDEIVEMDGSFPVRPLSSVSTYPPVWTQALPNIHNDSFRRAPSLSVDSTHTDTNLANQNLAPAIPPKITHDHYAEQVEDPGPSRTEEMFSPTISEAMQPFDQASSPANTSAGPSHSFRSNSMPTTSAFGSNTTHDTNNIKRKPTKKWRDAMPANYNGEDYGNGVDEYHNEEALRAVQEVEFQEQMEQSILHENQARQSHEQYQQPFPGRWPGWEREEPYPTYGHAETRPDPAHSRPPALTIDITSPTPDPIQQHYRSFSDPEVFVPRPLFSDQPEVVPSYDDGYDAPLERTLTVGEMRRKRRKATQAMMSRQSSM